MINDEIAKLPPVKLWRWVELKAQAVQELLKENNSHGDALTISMIGLQVSDVLKRRFDDT